MRQIAILLLSGCVGLLAAAQGFAATINVPGDQPTIAAGLAAASAGDEVLVACGTYYEHNLVLPSGVTLRGDGGDPSCVVIDAEGAGRALLVSGLAQAVAVEALTVQGGAAENGAGLFVDDAQCAVTNCRFQDNTATVRGGAIVIGTGDLSVTDCYFFQNSAGSYDGGAINVVEGGFSATNCVFEANSADYGGALVLASGTPTVQDCRFIDNVAGYGGAVVTLLATTPTFLGCLFKGNSAQYGGAGYQMLGSITTYDHCTFVENAASVQSAGVHSFVTNTILRNCIIAFSTEGAATGCELTSSITLLCCDLYGNAGGDWTGCIADQLGVNGNISEDPYFCLADNPDEPYTVAAFSICSELNNPDCGQIGAFGTGCGVTGVEDTSFSRVKSLY